MTIEAQNCVVGIEYELKEAGKDTVLDTNKGQQPLEFVMGAGRIIPGLEKGLVGMEEGDSAKIEVPASEAYGEKDPESLRTLPKEQFEGIDLQVGMTLYGEGEGGHPIQVTVADFDENGVTVDFGHPMAGKDLVFAVTVTDVREATEEEMATGEVGGHCADGSCGCGH